MANFSTYPTLADQIDKLEEYLDACESIIIGAGAGLSSAVGFDYSGARFDRYFGDLAQKYDISDMYSGGFYPYPTLEAYWAFWSRQIWLNRYTPLPGGTYANLLDLVKDKDYFVITTNVDHCFQRAGFDKKRLFYTQGDFGLFQCSLPCREETWDNRKAVKAMLEVQGFVVEAGGTLTIPDGAELATSIPSELVPRCPHCDRPLTPNLRIDGTFVEDAGWHEASTRYHDFLRTHTEDGQPVLFLELGVGQNTPVIIKYPFWEMTGKNKAATYASINHGEAYAPRGIAARSLCIDGDIDYVLKELTSVRSTEEGCLHER